MNWVTEEQALRGPRRLVSQLKNLPKSERRFPSLLLKRTYGQTKLRLHRSIIMMVSVAYIYIIYITYSTIFFLFALSGQIEFF